MTRSVRIGPWPSPALSGKHHGEAFNFGLGQPVTVDEVVQELMRQTGRTDLAPVILDQAKGEIPDQFLDASKASEQLGWRPSFSLADGSATNHRLVPRVANRVRLQTTELEGLLVLEPEPIVDERGFFARIWDRDELLARDLPGEIVQCSIAFNEIRGTLRGLHFQEPPTTRRKRSAAPRERSSMSRSTCGPTHGRSTSGSDSSLMPQVGEASSSPQVSPTATSHWPTPQRSNTRCRPIRTAGLARNSMGRRDARHLVADTRGAHLARDADLPMLVDAIR